MKYLLRRELIEMTGLKLWRLRSLEYRGLFPSRRRSRGRAHWLRAEIEEWVRLDDERIRKKFTHLTFKETDGAVEFSAPRGYVFRDGEDHAVFRTNTSRLWPGIWKHREQLELREGSSYETQEYLIGREDIERWL